MWYEDDQSNWKNSEVISIFADIAEQSNYFQPETVGPVVEPPAILDSSVSPVAVMESAENVNAADERLELRASLQQAVDKLNQLSSKYGNEKVRYMLERAAAELQDTLDSGEQNEV